MLKYKRHQMITVRGENVGVKHNIQIVKHYNSPDSYLRDLEKNHPIELSLDDLIDVTPQYNQYNQYNEFNNYTQRNTYSTQSQSHQTDSTDE